MAIVLRQALDQTAVERPGRKKLWQAQVVGEVVATVVIRTRCLARAAYRALKVNKRQWSVR